MSQQITIILMIDIEAALNAGKLEGNIYMLDNLRTEGSEGEGTGNLITAINGNYWCNGSQASEVVLNWLPSGIAALPNTLPRNYHESRTKKLNQQLLNNFTGLNNDQDPNLETNLENIGSIHQIKDAFGNVRDHETRVLTVTGKPYAKNSGNEPASYPNPIITDITGEAVDKGVLFTAQYGTPISLKDGWYWSATADTSKTGIYSYILHITLYKPIEIEGVTTWEPVRMAYESQVKVTSLPKRNGFSNGAMVELPI